MNHLVPCPECSRHVRVSETECPFCAVPLALAGTPEPRLPRERLSRAATLAFGTTFASAGAISMLVACSSASVPVYGGPAGGPNVAGTSGMETAGTNSGVGGDAAVPVYGAPAGGVDGTGTGGSGNGAGGGPVPVYGAAP